MAQTFYIGNLVSVPYPEWTADKLAGVINPRTGLTVFQIITDIMQDVATGKGEFSTTENCLWLHGRDGVWVRLTLEGEFEVGEPCA